MRKDSSRAFMIFVLPNRATLERAFPLIKIYQTWCATWPPERKLAAYDAGGFAMMALGIPGAVTLSLSQNPATRLAR